MVTYAYIICISMLKLVLRMIKEYDVEYYAYAMIYTTFKP